DDGRKNDRAADTKATGNPVGGECSRHRPEVADRERSANRQRAEMQLSAGEHKEDGEPRRPEEVEEGSTGGDVLQVRVAQDVAKAFSQLDAHLPSRRPFS